MVSVHCPKKDCVCGGGKSDCGCLKQQKSCELFRLTAKVFSLQQSDDEESAAADKDSTCVKSNLGTSVMGFGIYI